jgi:hypothetical protein
MQNELGERWRTLCEKIAVEEDPARFSMLFTEMALLLEQRQAELQRAKRPPRAESQADGIAC